MRYGIAVGVIVGLTAATAWLVLVNAILAPL